MTKIMETKKSKCVVCTFNQEFDWQDKKWYKYLVVFENGDTGFISDTTKAEPFVVGAEAEYTIEPNPKKQGEFRIRKPKADGGFQKRPFGVRQTKSDYLTANLSFTQSYIKDLIVAEKIVPIKDKSIADLWIENTKKLLEFSEAKIKEYLSE
jgi:hypothetical protein